MGIKINLKIVWFSLAVLVFTLVSILYSYPIFKNIENWWAFDWDLVAFLNGAARITITEYHQFPLWNPYYFGGLPLLGNPQSQFLSPFFFLFVIPFGEFIGFKIQIFLHLIIGMLGMFFLSRYFKLGRVSQFLPSFIYMLSSYYPYNIAEGHFSHITIAWIPWVFLFYLKAYKNWRYCFAASGLLTLMFFQGSNYPLAYTILLLGVYSFFNFIKEKSLVSIKTVLLIFVFTFLFSGIKLVPTMELLDEYPRKISGGLEFNLDLFGRGLLYSQHGLNRWGFLYRVFDFDGSGLNFLATSYIGFIPVILAIFGSILIFRRWSLLITTLVFMFLIFGSKAPINLWEYLHYLPFYNSLQSSSTVLFIIVFLLAIIIGFASSKIEELETKRYKIPFLTVVIVLFILFDLITLNGQIFIKSFWIWPKEIERSNDFYHVSTYFDYSAYSSMYPALLSNYGLTGGYDYRTIPTRVKPTLKANCSAHTDWMVGPIKSELGSNISFEEKINSSSEYETVGWKLFEPELLLYPGLCMVYFNFLPIADLLMNNSEVYISNYVYSPDKRFVKTRLANDDFVTLWVNNNLAYTYNHRSDLDMDELPWALFELDKGWNKVVFKSTNVVQAWFLGIEDLKNPADNTPLNDLVYSVSKNEISPDLPRIPDKAFSEEAYVLGGGSAKINYFSPNKIEVDVDVRDSTTLVVNQNYFKGWRTKEGLKVEPYENLISVKISPDVKKMTFYYLPNSFLLGVFLSLSGVLLMIILLKRY